jgi:hypothetical protein
MKPSGSWHKRTVVKSWLKAVLALAAVVTVTVSLYLGRQALDASPVAAPVFGSLLPLSLTAPTQLPLFVIYGLATALPVAIGLYLTLSGTLGVL